MEVGLLAGLRFNRCPIIIFCIATVYTTRDSSQPEPNSQAAFVEIGREVRSV
jgi:hypothetical protein